MERILEKLYNGEISPCDNNRCDDPNYRELCRCSLDETDAFAQRLDQDQREQFDELMEHYLEICYMEKTQSFTDGFRLGARMMCDVFYGGQAC